MTTTMLLSMKEELAAPVFDDATGVGFGVGVDGVGVGLVIAGQLFLTEAVETAVHLLTIVALTVPNGEQPVLQSADEQLTADSSKVVLFSVHEVPKPALQGSTEVSE